MKCVPKKCLQLGVSIEIGIAHICKEYTKSNHAKHFWPI